MVASTQDTAVVAPTQLPAMAAKEKVAAPEVLNQPLTHNSNIIMPHSLMHHLNWWKRRAPTKVLDLITHGVLPNWPEPDLNFFPCHRASSEVAAARLLMEEYIKIGAAQVVTSQDCPTRYLIPWFLIQKPGKNRLIADCRVLNKFISPPISDWTIGRTFSHF